MLTYQSNPWNAGILPLDRFKKGDVAFIVNFFGFKPSAQNHVEAAGTVEVIEDHSHDVLSDWALHSRADWCVASLRKTIPVPDGGVLWSPRRKRLPKSPPLTDEHYLAAIQKHTALAMKSCFLEGGFDSKMLFRKLSMHAEQNISLGQVSGASPWVESFLKIAPVDRWRSIRSKNYKILAESVAGIPWIKFIQHKFQNGVSPYSVILIFHSQEITRYMRHKLIQSRIYPAVLWPLDSPRIQGVPAEDISLSKRMLSIACDARYDGNDMRQVAGILIQHGESKEKHNSLS